MLWSFLTEKLLWNALFHNFRHFTRPTHSFIFISQCMGRFILWKSMNCLNIKTYYFLFSLSESVSRGYAEVYLPELLTSMAGGCSSELLRCITLDPKQHSSSTSGLMGGPSGAGLSSAGGGAWDFASSPASSSTSLTIRKPTVTAEVSLFTFFICYDS